MTRPVGTGSTLCVAFVVAACSTEAVPTTAVTADGSGTRPAIALPTAQRPSAAGPAREGARATSTFTPADYYDDRRFYDESCDVPAILRSLAGPEARDCGHIGLQADRHAADACVLEELAAERPFLVLYDDWGIDTDVATGYYSAGYGQIVGLFYDSGHSHGPVLQAVPLVTPTAGPPGTPVKPYPTPFGESLLLLRSSGSSSLLCDG